MYLNKDDLYFSLIYGNGVYRKTKEIVSDPLRFRYSDKNTIILENILHDGEYFTRGIQEPKGSDPFGSIKEMILLPPPTNRVLWPCDIVSIPEKVVGAEQIESFFVPCYNKPTEDVPMKHLLLFPRRSMEGWVSLKEKFQMFAQSYGNYFDVSSWRHYKNIGELRDIAVSLVELTQTLNDAGYYYPGYSTKDIYINEAGEICLDFSNLFYNHVQFTDNDTLAHFNLKKLNDTKEKNLAAPSLGEFHFEHVLPQIHRYVSVEEFTQNYGLASILFLILFGKHPCDGRLRVGDMEDTEFNYHCKYENIYNQPVFIFDESDVANRLTDADINRVIKENWTDCGNEMQDCFKKSLSMGMTEDNVFVQRFRSECKTPGEWMRCFQNLSWTGGAV